MKLFIFDFDGTIITEDSTDLILGLPGEDEIWRIEDEWKRGKITSYQCMKAQARYLKGIPVREIHRLLREHSHVDPHFFKLMQFLNAEEFHLVVLSEGYDVAIQFHQIENYIPDIHCSRLRVDKGTVVGELEVSNQQRWDYNEQCIGCCICKVDYLRRWTKDAAKPQIFAVGDGRSDECLFRYTDVSFSLNPRYQATYQTEDLGDVLRLLQQHHT